MAESCSILLFCYRAERADRIKALQQRVLEQGRKVRLHQAIKVLPQTDLLQYIKIGYIRGLKLLKIRLCGLQKQFQVVDYKDSDCLLQLLGLLYYSRAALCLDSISEIKVALQLITSTAVVLLHTQIHLVNNILYNSYYCITYRAVSLNKLLDVG